MDTKKKESIFSSFKFKLALMLVITIVASSAITYGFFYTNKEQSGKNKVATTCFDVAFSEGKSISLKNAASMTDASGQNTSPYTFTITNNCDNETAYTVILSSKNGSFSDEFISLSLNKEPSRVLGNTMKNLAYEKTPEYDNSYIIERGALKKDESATYDLRAWINAKATYDDVKGRTWDGEIKVISGIKSVEDMRWLSSKLPTIAKDTTPDFTSTSTTDEGIYKISDEDGTSYYYRGASTNNYMNFAGLTWRIIRMNGDGSLRLLYDGTTVHDNGEASPDRVAINDIIPLMEGGENNIASELEKWYQENIKDKNFDKYVTVGKYCTNTIETITTPTFKCNNSIKTNKIGLITADELVAGGFTEQKPNTNAYAYKGTSYWLQNRASDGTIYTLTSDGLIKAQDETEPNNLAPVINIDSKYVDMITGDGSKEKPYTIAD